MSIILQHREKTAETRELEDFFRTQGFTDVEAYRYNPASIRLRLRDERFRDLSITDRMNMVDAVIGQLPDEIQQQLIFVLPFALGEESDSPFAARNREFEDGTV